MAKLTRSTLRYGVAVLAVAMTIAFLAVPEVGKGFASIVLSGRANRRLVRRPGARTFRHGV